MNDIRKTDIGGISPIPQTPKEHMFFVDMREKQLEEQFRRIIRNLTYLGA